ncbi:MAG: ATP-binding protein, partial [Betaproteobacteria bacterium]|nr:ATP-binding protein [Betaproteobacteria bacterium]
NLFRLAFIETHANAIFLGGVGLGKSHLAIALGHSACLQGYSALFTTAVDIINTLAAARINGGLKREMAKYLKPRVLIVDLCCHVSNVKWMLQGLAFAEARRVFDHITFRVCAAS